MSSADTEEPGRLVAVDLDVDLGVAHPEVGRDVHEVGERLKLREQSCRTRVELARVAGPSA